MYGEAHPSEALQLFVLNLYLHLAYLLVSRHVWALFCHSFWFWQAEDVRQTLSAASKRTCVFVQHPLHSLSIIQSTKHYTMQSTSFSCCGGWLGVLCDKFMTIILQMNGVSTMEGGFRPHEERGDKVFVWH